MRNTALHRQNEVLSIVIINPKINFISIDTAENFDHFSEFSYCIVRSGEVMEFKSGERRSGVTSLKFQ